MTTRITPRVHHFERPLRAARRWLESRWVRVLLFLGVLVAAWLWGMPTAHGSY